MNLIGHVIKSYEARKKIWSRTKPSSYPGKPLTLLFITYICIWKKKQTV